MANAQELWLYLKNPEPSSSLKISVLEKLKILIPLVLFVLVIALVIGGLINTTLEYFKVIHLDEHSVYSLFKNSSSIKIFLFAIVIAPVIEELIFRAPLPLFNAFKTYFKYVFYAFALVFAYVHIFNFELTPSVLIVSPLLVLPQFLVGLTLAYIRLRLGLLYSILGHSLYNLILITPLILFKDQLL